MFINRSAENTLKKLLGQYPVVAVTGPRQSGKTTLVRHVCCDKAYVLLEDLDTREFAQTDPRGFLAQFPDGAILDEVQRCPQLLSYLQGIVDREQRVGHFILTGSQQFSLRSGLSQTLAGRVALLPLLPFSLQALAAAGKAPESLVDMLWMGAYPPIYDRGYEPSTWYANYVRTYIERDVRDLINVRDLSTFQRFVRLCAGRNGQLVNLSSLAADCGITHNTAKSWLGVLEASYLIYLLQPYHRNFNKRLVKTPKLYFLDAGLAAWLLGVQRPEHLQVHPLFGALFESWVVSECLKARWHSGKEPNFYFWRDRSGHEVDLLVDQGVCVLPVEIKSGQTIGADFFRPLKRWQDLVGDFAASPALVYGGDVRQQRSHCDIVPWRTVPELASRF
ncbi:MAG TPA: ATP-binding protein [Pelovirga sp.]|nr:ATP-binding protein [Pelovirga sp.]